MPDACKNWLGLVNICVYYARQARDIYQVLPFFYLWNCVYIIGQMSEKRSWMIWVNRPRESIKNWQYNHNKTEHKSTMYIVCVA